MNLAIQTALTVPVLGGRTDKRRQEFLGEPFYTAIGLRRNDFSTGGQSRWEERRVKRPSA